MTDPVYAVAVEFQTGSFTDITDDVLRITAHRALANGIDPLSPGGCNLLLDNMDGRYSPDYPGSQYYGLLRPNLQVKVQATHSGSTYNVFRGYIDEWLVDPNLETQRRATLSCRDTLKAIRNKLVTTSLALDMPVMSFATTVLSQTNVSSFTVHSMADTFGFQWFDQRPAMTAVQDMLVSGFFFGYVDGGGTLNMRPRATIFPGSVIGSLNTFLNLDYTLTDDRLINRAIVNARADTLGTQPQSIGTVIQSLYLTSGQNASFALDYRDRFGAAAPATYLLPPHYGVYMQGATSAFYVCSAAHANVANGKTGSFVMRGGHNMTGSIHAFLCSSGNYFVGINSGGSTGIGEIYGCFHATAGGAKIFEFVTRNSSLNGALFVGGSMYNIAVSWNLGTGSAQVVVNNQVKSIAVLTAVVNTNINYNSSNNLMFRTPAAGGNQMGAQFVWFDNLNELNFASSYYNAFFDPEGEMRWLGYTGEAPLGCAPLVFNWNGFGEWGTNRGRGSNYALSAAGSTGNCFENKFFYVGSPSGQYGTALPSMQTTFSLMNMIASISFVGNKSGQLVYTMRGHALTTQGIVPSQIDNGSSQSLYDTFPREFSSPFISNQSYANVYAEFITSRYAYPRAEMNIAVANDFPALLGWEVGQQLFITNSLTSIGKFSIKRLSHDIDLSAGLQHVTDAVLEKVAGWPNAVGFDGTNDYATRGAGLTGAADSKLLSGSFWIKTNADGSQYYVVNAATAAGGGTARNLLHKGVSDLIGIQGNNSAGTIILNISTTANSVEAADGWVNVLFSVDLSDTAKRHIYINDVSDLATVTTYTDDTIDFTQADWGLGARPDGSNKLNGALAEVWYAPGQYIDLSIESNRRKFISASGGPVGLGNDGSAPTGTAPPIYMKDPAATFGSNSGTGGAFTVTGALEDVAPPS